jgi:hypothetical protein
MRSAAAAPYSFKSSRVRARLHIQSSVSDVVSSFGLKQVGATKNEAYDAVTELLSDASSGFAGAACLKFKAKPQFCK